MTNPDGDDDEGGRLLTEEEIAALPDDPSEIFDPAGLVDYTGPDGRRVHGDALLPPREPNR